MKKLALLMLCLWPSVVWSQPQILLLDRTLVDNQFLYSTTTLTRGQIVIQSNGTNPCLGVFGLGARSRLTPDAAANTAGVFITTSDSTCIEPAVEYVSLYGNHGVPDSPAGDPVVDTADAIVLGGDAVIVRHNQIFDFEGVAIRCNPHSSEFSSQRRVARISDNNISHCNNGIEIASVDACVANNTISSVAQYGIRDLGGSAQLSGNHCFGNTTAISFENGASRSTNDKASDAATNGFNIASTAAKSSIQGLTSIHCGNRNIYVQATDVRISGSYIEVARSGDNVNVDYDGAVNGIEGGLDNQIVGIHVAAERCSIIDCAVDVSDYVLNFATGTPRASVGIVLGASNQTVRDVRLEGTSAADEKGVVILPDLKGLDVSVTTAGGTSDFDGTGDTAIVWFCDDNDAVKTWQGTVDVTYDPYTVADIPVRIPAGWTDALRIRIRASLDNSTTSPWVELAPGTAYP